MSRAFSLLLATTALAGCQSLTIDKIVIRTPNWLPGVDIHMDVEEDVREDWERYQNQRNDVQEPVLCDRCGGVCVRRVSEQPRHLQVFKGHPSDRG